jgi:hypothetical protein
MSAAKARQERMLEEVLRLPGNSTSFVPSLPPASLHYISHPISPRMPSGVISHPPPSPRSLKKKRSEMELHKLIMIITSIMLGYHELQIGVRIVRLLRPGGLVSVSVSQVKSSLSSPCFSSSRSVCRGLSRSGCSSSIRLIGKVR